MITFLRSKDAQHRLTLRSRAAIGLGLSLTLLTLPSLSGVQHASAQEVAEAGLDSNEMRIQELIKKGQEALKRTKSRRIKRNSRKKKAALKEALKSFSFAHRFMTDLQLDNPSLTEQINAGYTEALSDPLIQKELRSVEARLTKALAAKDNAKAYEAALELSQLDARSPEYVYLMKVFNTLQPTQN